MKTLAKVAKLVLWVIGLVFVLLLLLLIASIFVDERLSTFFEDTLNEKLTGYEVRIEDVDFNPLGPSILLEGVTILQEKNPDPPVARFAAIDVGVHWRPIFSGRLVGEIALERPAFHFNLQQLREEAKREEKVQDRGWQEAMYAIYPLRINLFTITDGELTYIDQDPKRPLQVRQIHVEATNIRNIETEDRVYPSPFRLEAILLEEGHATLEGHANFLAEPYPGVEVRLDIANVPLNYFAPILERYHIVLSKGWLNASGRAEISPEVKAADLQRAEVRELELHYYHSAASQPAAEKTAEKTKEAAKEVSNNPEFRLRIGELLVGGYVGMTNQTTDPAYKLYLQNTDLRLTNLSNHFSQGPAKFQLSGVFMGSGKLATNGTFRPEKDGPDFDLNLQIEGTQLKDLNDLLRVYGNFDVVAGTFSIYSELQVKNDQVDGYVKPLFSDVDVYDRRQDEDKNLFTKMYEGLVEGVSELLSRDPEERVATKTDVSGPVEDPQANTWQALVRLIQNAFTRAVLPGFDREVRGASERK